MNNFKIFSVGDDRPEYIVATNEEEAVKDHMSRLDEDYYGDEGPDVSVIPFESEGRFETENGYKNMTFGEFLGDFKYKHPQVVCWSE